MGGWFAMVKFSILVFVLLTLACCAPCRRMATPIESSRDSVTIELRPRVVEFAETLRVELPQYREQTKVLGDTSILENPYARSEAIVTPKGELLHTLESAKQTIDKVHTTQVEVRDSIVWRERVDTKIVERERELTKWQQIRLNGFWVLLLVVIIMIRL